MTNTQFAWHEHGHVSIEVATLLCGHHSPLIRFRLWILHRHCPLDHQDWHQSQLQFHPEVLHYGQFHCPVMPVTSNDLDTKAGRSSSFLSCCLNASLTTTDDLVLRDNT